MLFFFFGIEINRDAIVSWLKKKTGSAIKNVTTTEEAKKLLESEPKLVVAFVDSLTVLTEFPTS